MKGKGGFAKGVLAVGAEESWGCDHKVVRSANGIILRIRNQLTTKSTEVTKFGVVLVLCLLCFLWLLISNVDYE